MSYTTLLNCVSSIYPFPKYISKPMLYKGLISVDQTSVKTDRMLGVSSQGSCSEMATSQKKVRILPHDFLTTGKAGVA